MKETSHAAKDIKYATGMLVMIRPEWDGDNTLYVIAEWNGDRGFIRPVNWSHGSFTPTELVAVEMIQPATINQ